MTDNDVEILFQEWTGEVTVVYGGDNPLNPETTAQYTGFVEYEESIGEGDEDPVVSRTPVLFGSQKLPAGTTVIYKLVRYKILTSLEENGVFKHILGGASA